MGAELSIEERLSKLEDKSQITQVADQRYKISDNARKRVVTAMSQREAIRIQARNKFEAIVRERLPDLDQDRVWDLFEKQLLEPIVIDLGAQAWNFITNNEPLPWTSLPGNLDRFLNNFPINSRNEMKAAAASFFDPRLEAPRAFFVDTFNASFFSTACGLTSDELGYIAKLIANPISIEAILDVDLMLAANGLFDQPTNEVATNLIELERRERFVAGIDLSVTDVSVRQAQYSLRLARRICAKDTADGVSAYGALLATIEGVMSGFISRGDRDCQRYFSDFMSWLPEGCVRLFSNPLLMSAYDHSSDPDVSSGIRTYRTFLKVAPDANIGNDSELRVEHDVALRFFVRNLRGGDWKYLGSNRFWAVSDNTFLLDFDALTAKRTGSVPVCVHPLTLLQMLRLWLPRNETWDRAVTSSMRLPFVHLGESGKLDRAAVQVLGALARHETSHYDDEFLIASLVNEELRRAAIRPSQLPVQETASELASGRAEIESARNEIEAARQELKAQRESIERRKLGFRIFGFGGSLSIILAALLVIVLMQNVAVLSSVLVASVIAALTASLITLAAANFYVRPMTSAAAKFWRDRLHRWILSLSVLVITNLVVAVLASAIYDSLRHR